MARPLKQGLDYFPFDVDFFADEKIAAISGEFGLKGEIAAIKLLCAIYRNGYFIRWSEALKFKLLRDLPGVSSELLDQIVNRLVRWGFFDEALFDSVKVLTSRGIQERFFSITKRRSSNNEDMKYLLVSVCRNGVIADKNTAENKLLNAKTPQSKGKKSKENSTSDEVEKKKPAASAATTDERKELFRKSLVPFVDQYGREMIREFFDYWTEKTQSGAKMRYELERTWETPRRLATWSRRKEEKSCAKREGNDNYGLRKDAETIGRTERRSTTL